MRQIALLDQANAEAGSPPRQFFVHQGGASWEALILQPAHHTDEESGKNWIAAFKKLGIAQGARSSSSHSGRFPDRAPPTRNVEATTAAEYLKKLE